jgi:hypothetical protein
MNHYGPKSARNFSAISSASHCCFLHAIKIAMNDDDGKSNVGRGEGRNGNIMEGVNLSKLYCMHVWNYHKETPPHIINV